MNLKTGIYYAFAALASMFQFSAKSVSAQGTDPVQRGAFWLSNKGRVKRIKNKRRRK